MNDIILPAPRTELQFPLMEAVKNRSTKRKWSAEPLSDYEISDLLWCAAGETRAATKTAKSKRTIPSACNSQLVSVYAAMHSGVYKYDETKHMLNFIAETDIRGGMFRQKMINGAQFGLIYIADFSKKTGIMKSDYDKKLFLAATEAGAMSQNVYLYCAANNLNTVLCALYDEDFLKEALCLKASDVVIYTQAVGKAP